MYNYHLLIGYNYLNIRKETVISLSTVHNEIYITTPIKSSTLIIN